MKVGKRTIAAKGDKYGNLIATGRNDSNMANYTVSEFTCICNKKVWFTLTQVKSETHKRHCGCLGKKEPIRKIKYGIGFRIGNMEIIRRYKGGKLDVKCHNCDRVVTKYTYHFSVFSKMKPEEQLLASCGCIKLKTKKGIHDNNSLLLTYAQFLNRINIKYDFEKKTIDGKKYKKEKSRLFFIKENKEVMKSLYDQGRGFV